MRWKREIIPFSHKKCWQRGWGTRLRAHSWWGGLQLCALNAHHENCPGRGSSGRSCSRAWMEPGEPAAKVSGAAAAAEKWEEPANPVERKDGEQRAWVKARTGRLHHTQVGKVTQTSPALPLLASITKLSGTDTCPPTHCYLGPFQNECVEHLHQPLLSR